MHTADPFQLLSRVLACFLFYSSPFLAIRAVKKMQLCVPEAERSFQRVLNNPFELKGVPGIPSGPKNNAFNSNIVKSLTPFKVWKQREGLYPKMFTSVPLRQEEESQRASQGRGRRHLNL